MSSAFNKMYLIFLLVLFSCKNDIDTPVKYVTPVVNVEVNSMIPVDKDFVPVLSIELVHYGAKYCLSVAEQLMKQAVDLNCVQVIELCKVAIINSSLSLELYDPKKAKGYLKEAENSLYQAVDLFLDCDEVDFYFELLKG